MKNKIYRIGKNALLIWGAISLIGVILIFTYLAYSTTIGNKTVENQADKTDVKFVLNWCELGGERIKKVINSYESARSFNGDYLDAYAIEISDISESELIKNDKWYNLDELPLILNNAVDLADSWQYKIPWFPKIKELKKESVYVYPWSINCNGIKPTSTQLIFAIPNDKMIYYLGTKM